ncbi:hypothetical protein OXIME_000300 [Oxyplasma meridianum]|uniref:Transposase n=1 Tax=Oxyplasma meridianum TaxID=3073602 RepID=A0AAX4NEN1_9ARCH
MKRFKDRVAYMKNIMDWDRIKPILNNLYRNDTGKYGRPNFDPVFIIIFMIIMILRS